MHNKSKMLFWGILSVIFVGMLLLNLLTPLLADDYLYSFSFATGERITNIAQIIPSLAAHATKMNGRLVPHFFVQLFTLLPRWAFAIVNTEVYMALLLGMYRLTNQSGKRYYWPLLLIVSGAVFLFIPAFGQSFLWLAGSVNYLWCDALMVWLLVPFSDAIFRGKQHLRIGHAVLLGVGALLLGNMSENVSAAAVLFMGLCTVWKWRKDRKITPWMAVTTIMAGIGWIALMLAPANRMNVAQASGGFNLLAEHYQTALSMWLQYGMWPSVAFIALLCAAYIGKYVKREQLAFAAGLFLCALACNFAMTMADYYPPRAITGSMILLILAFAVILGADHTKFTVVRAALALTLALMMSLYALGALPNAYNRYVLAQQRVNEVIGMRGTGEMDITTYGIKGLSRFDAFDGLNELTNEADYFPNVYYAKYYHLNSIVVDRFE